MSDNAKQQIATGRVNEHDMLAALEATQKELDDLSQAVQAAGRAGYFENWTPAYRRAQKQVKAVAVLLSKYAQGAR